MSPMCCARIHGLWVPRTDRHKCPGHVHQPSTCISAQQKPPFTNDVGETLWCIMSKQVWAKINNAAKITAHSLKALICSLQPPTLFFSTLSDKIISFLTCYFPLHLASVFTSWKADVVCWTSHWCVTCQARPLPWWKTFLESTNCAQIRGKVTFYVFLPKWNKKNILDHLNWMHQICWSGLLWKSIEHLIAYLL